MGNLQQLERAVEDLYASKQPGRDEWADWLYENHVLWVADKAAELAEQFGGNKELTRAAALLHDISDAKMNRDEPVSEQVSLQLAAELLKSCGYTQAEIELVVDDAIRYHSCRDGELPISREGKLLATADAMAHFQTDFYPYAFSMKLFKDYQKTKAWCRAKIEKDYNNKIFFDEIKQELKPQYETLRLIFGS